MSSVSTSNSIRSKLNHTLSTNNNAELSPVTYSRVVSSGKSLSGNFRIRTYRTESSSTYRLPVQKVDTYQDYIAGCTQHESCLGHFCQTPRGTILVPQRLASTLGIMSNDFAKMAEQIYIRDSPSQQITYREKLRSLMLGKTGKMRGDMPSGVVDGSMRLVLSECWELKEKQIAIPRRVAENMRVLRVERDAETGLVIDEYSETELRENDWNINVRPPSLWAGNVQPCQVVLWDHECIGMNPAVAEDFHADCDGDEFHGYYITTEKAVKQCEKWKPLTKDKFKQAVEEAKLPKYLTESTTDLRGNFMVCSTVSIKELVEGEQLPKLAKAARVKEPMVNMFVDRLANPEQVFKDFTRSSIQGIRDVMAQQLDQGLLGDMSRQARLSASCVSYKGNGIFYIRTGNENIKCFNSNCTNLTLDQRYPLGGNPCMRGIAALCSVAQQAALDSHRVSQSVSSSLDLINSLIVGSEESLVVFPSKVNVECKWKLDTGTSTFCIIDNESVGRKALLLIGAYSPTVLKMVKLMGGNVKKVCRVGISTVCNYYNVKLSVLEVESLVELFCYRVEAFDKPITTKEGISRRDMRWMVAIFANHYGMLRNLQNTGRTKKAVYPETITDASACCSFDYL